MIEMFETLVKLYHRVEKEVKGILTKDVIDTLCRAFVALWVLLGFPAFLIANYATFLISVNVLPIIVVVSSVICFFILLFVVASIFVRAIED